MATKEDLEKTEADEAEDEGAEEEAPAEVSARAKSDAPPDDEPEASDPEADAAPDDGEEDEHAPLQLGHTRYVYAAYMAGALGIAFLFSKIGHAAWFRLSQWKPDLGEPKDELVIAGSVIVGAGTALYYWRRQDARQYANEVAEELSKVTWPSRKEVTNSTAVVIATTLAATVFFALMDRFWGFVTNLVYGS
jgi:preprotein translocase subunit SecE